VGRRKRGKEKGEAGGGRKREEGGEKEREGEEGTQFIKSIGAAVQEAPPF
jgi:hypothetical protein